MSTQLVTLLRIQAALFIPRRRDSSVRQTGVPAPPSLSRSLLVSESAVALLRNRAGHPSLMRERWPSEQREDSERATVSSESVIHGQRVRGGRRS
jgi:hypothetical protein